MTLADVETLLRTEERDLAVKVGRAEVVLKSLDEKSGQLRDEKARVERTEKTIEVLNSYADARQVDLISKIERLVTHGLKTIFGSDMEFLVQAKQVGKRTNLEFLVRSTAGTSVVETPVLDARGGGVAAVSGFVLRLVMLLLRPDARPILFLDESFAQLSAEYEPALAEFIAELVAKTRVQIVMVTHSSAYDEVADRSYRFTLKDGVTQVERLDS